MTISDSTEKLFILNFLIFALYYHNQLTNIFVLFMDRPRIDGEYLEGNDRYEGYSMDLIDGIARILGFHYRFEIVADNKYGSLDKKTKKWDGLVKHLLDRVGENNLFFWHANRSDRREFFFVDRKFVANKKVEQTNEKLTSPHISPQIIILKELISVSSEYRKLIWLYVT